MSSGSELAIAHTCDSQPAGSEDPVGVEDRLDLSQQSGARWRSGERHLRPGAVGPGEEGALRGERLGDLRREAGALLLLARCAGEHELDVSGPASELGLYVGADPLGLYTCAHRQIPEQLTEAGHA